MRNFKIAPRESKKLRYNSFSEFLSVMSGGQLLNSDFVLCRSLWVLGIYKIVQVHFMEANAENVNLKLVQARQPNLEYYVEHFQGQFLILTNADDNLNNCVMVADPKSPSKK